MATITINDIDGDAVHTEYHGDVSGAIRAYDELHPIQKLIREALTLGTAESTYIWGNEEFTTRVVATAKLEIGKSYLFGTGEDVERGTVAAINGDQVTVQWDQGIATTQKIDALEIGEETDSDEFDEDEPERFAYWIDGTAYCADCVECTSPCLGTEEIARATRSAGIGRCGCCGDIFG